MISNESLVIPLSHCLMFRFESLYSALYYYERERAAEILLELGTYLSI